jgi:BarA-like signal transduction histidine kinase
MDKIDELIQQATHDCMGVPVLDKRQLVQLVAAAACQALNPALRDMISRGQAADMIRQHFGLNSDSD